MQGSRSVVAGLDDALSEWWDHSASAAFAHRRYTGRLIDEQHVIWRWDALWLRNLTQHLELRGARVLEYGIGGGLCGTLLLRRYNLSTYIGVDVSNASLSAARQRLKRTRWPGTYRPGWELLHTPQNFSRFSVDLFLCIAVIQHFPSRAYTAAFFRNLESSGIPRLLLQVKLTQKDELYSAVNESEHIISNKTNFARVYGTHTADATRLPYDYVHNSLPSYYRDVAVLGVQMAMLPGQRPPTKRCRVALGVARIRDAQARAGINMGSVPGAHTKYIVPT